MNLHGLQEDNLHHCGLLQGLQGNIFSGAWMGQLLLLLLHLSWCLQGCFSRIFSLLSLTGAVQCFLPFLKYVITAGPPASLIGSALACSGSVLGLAKHVSD